MTPILAQDFLHFDVVFCDSLEALHQLRQKGLPLSARIRCSSPAMLEREPAAEDIEDNVAEEKVERFIASVNRFVADVFQRLRADTNNMTAISAAFGVFSQHRILHKALSVQEDDLQQPRLIVNLRTGDPKIDRVLNSFWADLLQENKAVTTFNSTVAKPSYGKSLGGSPPNPLLRLVNLRLDRLLYRLRLAYSHFWPKRFARTADVLLIRDSNDLLRDVARVMAFAGSRLEKLETPPQAQGELMVETTAQINKAIQSAFDGAFQGFFVPRLMPLLKASCISAACHEVSVAIGAERSWAARLSKFAKNGSVARPIILHGGPMGGAGAGLHAAAKKINIPLVAFQHGIRREIANWPIDVCVLNETNYSDLLICYNKPGARYSTDNIFAVCDAEPVGLPADYTTGGRRLSSKAPQPLIYISTLLYRGTRQISNLALTDHRRALWEIDLLREVFTKLPHRILFKPYPSFRYLDADPVHEAAKAAANIDIFDSEVDLRYVLHEHRVAITAGATSTVGWCALSEIPLVFIDDQKSLPLNAEARQSFAEAFFLFDANADGFKVKLRDFLARPIHEIEAESRMKVEARSRVVRNLFGVPHGDPKLAMHIINERFGARGARRG